MKIYRFIAVAVLALLVAGCGKDSGRIRITAEVMMGGGSKVFVDPTHVNDAAWVDGETVNLNGHYYVITEDNGKFYIDAHDNIPEAPYYAIYPAATNDGNGNNIAVTNGNTTGEVVLKSLVVNFHDDGHDIVFPMKAYAESTGSSLLFKHLTAGLRLTISDTSGANITLANVKVIARSTSAVEPIALDGITARWSGQGPTVPSGTIGENEDDVEIKYSSEMNFVLMTDGSPNVSFDGSGSRTFCIPITVSSLRYITVIGYSTTGVELFRRTKDLGDEYPLERNMMYAIPAVEF